MRFPRSQFQRFAVAIAIEEREVHLSLDQSRGLHAPDAAAQFADVPVHAELRIIARAAGLLLLTSALRWLESER